MTRRPRWPFAGVQETPGFALLMMVGFGAVAGALVVAALYLLGRTAWLDGGADTVDATVVSCEGVGTRGERCTHTYTAPDGTTDRVVLENAGIDGLELGERHRLWVRGEVVARATWTEALIVSGFALLFGLGAVSRYLVWRDARDAERARAAERRSWPPPVDP